jgi:hypothetical protein
MLWNMLTLRSVLCSDLAIRQIDEPFVTAKDNQAEWAL